MSPRHALQLTVFSTFVLICCSVATGATGLPSPPVGLTATAASCTGIKLTWTAPSDTGSANLFGYKVYRDGAFLKWTLSPATSTTDTSVRESTRYAYTAAALNSNGELSAQSAPAAVTTPRCSSEPSGPSAPTGLNALATSCDAIELSWNTPARSGSANILAYRVFRNGSFLKWVFPLATSITDRQVVQATTYSYNVEALNNAGELSPPSAPASAVTPPCSSAPRPPSAPTGLTASATGCNTIGLSWAVPSDSGSSGIAGYNVYRNDALLKRVQAPSTSTSDTGLAEATTYSYALSAIGNTDDESDRSTSARATTPACANQPPIADAGPDHFTQTLTAIPFNGSGSSDPDGTITSYVWDFGDGQSSSGVSVFHAYSTAGTYTVALTVTDDASLTARDTATVQASNRAPVAAAGPDRTAQAGTAVTFDGSGSSDPDGVITSYSWNFGDGGSATGATVSHTYPEAGDYVVTLTVTDNKGSSTRDTALVAVTQSSAGGGEFIWAQRFGDTDMDAGQAVAADSRGNVIATGRVLGTVDLGGGAPCSESIFLAKYTASGEHVWSQCFGDLGGGSGLAIAVDGEDNAVVTGYFTGSVDFGGGALTSAGGADVFVAKYAATGEHLWSNRFGSSVLTAFIRESGNAVAVDGRGDIVVTGIFEGTADFGGRPLVSAGQTDIFVAKYSAAGQHRWSRGFGDRGSLDSGEGVALDSSGNVLVTGNYAGAVDFGGGRLTGTGSTIFVAKYSPTGEHVWSQSFGGSNSDSGKSVAVDAYDNIVLTGTFRNTVNFGGGPLTSAGENDIFVAKYAPAGLHLWSKRLGSSYGSDSGNAVAVDTSGNVVVAGSFVGSVDFGGGELVSGGGTDVCVVKYSAAGAHLWSRSFGARSAQEANAATVSDSGVIVSGIMLKTVDFGDGPLTSAGGTDVFLLCLEP